MNQASRPATIPLSGTEKLPVRSVIYWFGPAIDPPETKSFFDGLWVRYARQPCFLFGINQPDSLLFMVVLHQPLAPVLATGRKKVSVSVVMDVLWRLKEQLN